MLRRTSKILMFLAALALVAGSSAFAQTKRHTHHPRAVAAKQAGGSGLGFGVSESLTGTIQMVVADQRLVVVAGPSGVPYDLVVTPKTVIMVGDKRATLESLTDMAGKAVSVGFVPQRDGNFATSIEVTG